MVELRDIAGFALDVGVSYGLEHAMKGGSAGLGKQMFVGSVAGGLGGVLGDAVANGGFSLQGSSEAFFYGALGGAVGASADRYISWRMAKGKTAADDALKEANSAKSTADADREALENAEKAHTAAQTDLGKAEDALRQANAELGPLQTRYDDALRRAQADPDNAILRDELNSARDDLKAAQDKVRAAEVARDKAREDLRLAGDKFNELDAKRGDLDSAKSAADDAFKNAEAAVKKAGKRADNFNKYQRGLLVGLGSATFMTINEHGMPWSSDGSGGDQPGAAVNRVPLMWDGYQPAAAAGLMGQPPFEQGSSPQKGQGFLLRPEGLNPSIALWYGGPSNSYAHSLVTTHEMFGDLKKKEDLKITPIPAMPTTVQNPSGFSAKGGATYKDLSQSLNEVGKKLTETQHSVVNVLPKVEEISKRGKENVGKIIVGTNRFMVERLQTGSDQEVLVVLGQGFSEIANEIQNAAQANQNLADGIQNPTAAQDAAAAQNLANSVGSYAGQMSNPGYIPDSSQIGVNNPWDPGNLGTSSATTPDTSALKDATEKFRDQAESLADAANTPSSVNPASFDPGAALNPGASQLGSAGSMGGMGSLMDMMLPLQLMAQQRAMREAVDPDMGDRLDDLDPSRYDQAAVPTMPQAQQPVGTTPWSNQAAANNAAATPAQPAVHHPAGAPNGATSSQPTTAMPKRVPGDDGLVPYVFPEETQRVPLAVALALDKAFANKSGTDAQAAYQGTAGAWTDSKDIGPAVDPAQLATGDVGTWIIRQPKKESQPAEPVPAQAGTDAQIQPAAMVTVGGDTGDKKNEPDTGSSGEPEYKTAILVVFGEGESGTLKAVVNGELQQYEAEMSDTGGDFGEFAGFKHPKGVEATGGKGQDSETMATSGDQTTADIPSLTMPV
ncbi:hypothetical protein [Nocardia testacea]|uniref:hypothetical protein n=1 Tax=Nocardia testacea TaxID=248551 RepID=UPI0002D5A840|nr:hypothetical protein [Nocardia testacea]